MTASGLLLRMVLMLSLLCNGLNVAMAGPMPSARAPVADAALVPAEPPCHAAGHAGMRTVTPPAVLVQAPADDDHCRIKQCLRSCAQQPSLAVQMAWPAHAPPLSLAPLSPLALALPPPPLTRITRPPIA